jgi:hypothetical protein
MQCLESNSSSQASSSAEVNREATRSTHSHMQRWVGGLDLLHLQGESTLAFIPLFDSRHKEKVCAGLHAVSKCKELSSETSTFQPSMEEHTRGHSQPYKETAKKF